MQLLLKSEGHKMMRVRVRGGMQGQEQKVEDN